MKKIYYSIGLTLLIIAAAYVTLIILKVCRSQPLDDFRAIFMMFFSFFMAASFFSFGKYSKNQELKNKKLIDESYLMLMDLYDEIKNNENDELSKRMFVIGVHEFGGFVWEVLTDMYPKDMKNDAEKKFDELMKRVAEFM